MIGVVLLVILAGTVGYLALTHSVFSSVPLSPTELKYRLRKHFRDKISFCGPSVGVMSIDPGQRFPEFPAIMRNTEEFQTILRHKNLTRTGPWSDQDKQLVIQEHRLLSAISLEPVGGKYQFRLRVPKSETEELTLEGAAAPMTPQLPANALVIEGFIDPTAVINIWKKEPIFHTCPR